MKSKESNNRKYAYLHNIPSGTALETITEGCLVLEGGGFRTLYTEGVLDYWMQNNINLSCVIGVSGGALSAISYLSGQIGRSARLNLGYRHDPDYIGVGAMKKSKGPVRLDFILEDYNGIEPLDEERLNKDQRRFVAVATSLQTGKPLFLEKANCSDMKAAVKASASLPYMSPLVYVDGVPCLDGGCSLKVPYQWAMTEGYEKVVVIRTRERSFRKKEHGKRKSAAARMIYMQYPEFVHTLENVNTEYNEQCEEMDILEKAGRMFVIAPSEPVSVSRLERDMQKLGHLYWLGYNDAANSLAALKQYLNITS